MALLEVQNLHTQIKLKKSTVQAVDGISFTVEAGETIGIVGESGSGKTMTAMSIMRLLPNGGSSPDGSIFLDGRDLLQLRRGRRCAKVRGNDVGMIFQDPMTSLNPTMTIGEQIAEAVRLHRGGSAGRRRCDRAVEVLGLVGMPAPQQRGSGLPAPALRRHAPARDDRHGAGLRAASC